jgi:hypothetical protein
VDPRASSGPGSYVKLQGVNQLGHYQLPEKDSSTDTDAFFVLNVTTLSVAQRFNGMMIEK